MKVKFLHLRPIQQYTTRNGTIRAPATRGGVCIAYEVKKEADGYHVFGVAACKCHSKDNYNKQVGRIKSSGRLKSPRFRLDAGGVPEKQFIEQSVMDFDAGNL